MNKTLISSAVAMVLAAGLASPVFAQDATTLERIQKEIAEMKAKNQRLEAEVEYLKENAKAARKEAATEAVAIDSLKTTTSKFTWSGDFRYRNEQISTTPNTATDEHTQGRDRIRLRLGVQVKINDTITGKFQLATAGGLAIPTGSTGAVADPRSRNQTLGEGWTSKSVTIDQAYVDWKAASFLNLQLGKTPLPWTRTASYFWDGDLTPEGAALKFSRGTLFGGVFYEWMNERFTADNGATNNEALRSDSKLIGAQFGIKQPIGPVVLTAAAAYFETTHVKDEVTASGTGCATNGAFFNNSTNGNTTYTGFGGCTRLLSEFAGLNALVQADFNAGKFPMSAFVDYMKNNKAEVNPIAKDPLDTAISIGVTFNKASAPKSWEIGYIYQVAEKDSIFGQYHDSDFGGGVTDTKGSAIKAAWVPAANWTLNGTYFLNKRFNDAPASATTADLDYKRLQLDLNFKF